MKTLLTEFNVSNALDDGSVAAKHSSSHGEGGNEVRQFEEAARELDRRFKGARPGVPTVAGLHDSIMRAVRSATRTQQQPFARTMLRWLPSPALALLIVGGLWWVLIRPDNQSHSLTNVAAVLEQSHELTQQAPAAVLAPLSKEMENLNRDFLNAVEYLVASVP